MWLWSTSKVSQHLGELGYPLEKVEFVKWLPNLPFRGDAASLSSWTVKLPVFINQKVGRIQAYLVKGETPMLLGRPIMESLGLLMDFHGQRIKFMDGVWQSPHSWPSWRVPSVTDL